VIGTAKGCDGLGPKQAVSVGDDADGECSFQVLGSRFSVLGSQFSVLSSQFSVLSSQFSVLSSQFVAFVSSGVDGCHQLIDFGVGGCVG
jgi:hypothetical protein